MPKLIMKDWAVHVALDADDLRDLLALTKDRRTVEAGRREWWAKKIKEWMKKDAQ